MAISSSYNLRINFVKNYELPFSKEDAVPYGENRMSFDNLDTLVLSKNSNSEFQNILTISHQRKIRKTIVVVNR